jgi:hypothetical protein
VSLVGLSDCLQLSGFAAGGGDDLSPQPAAASPIIIIKITLSRPRTAESLSDQARWDAEPASWLHRAMFARLSATIGPQPPRPVTPERCDGCDYRLNPSKTALAQQFPRLPTLLRTGERA